MHCVRFFCCVVLVTRCVKRDKYFREGGRGMSPVLVEAIAVVASAVVHEILDD